jgi:hypothetical protein
MNRDAVDLSLVHPHHEAIHARLSNWARWCRDGGGGSAVHPMFQEYKHSYDEPVILGVPCDTLDAIAVQKSFIQLPEKHRWVMCWWYCKPFIPVMRIRSALGLTTPNLYAMVHDSRTMMKNMLLRSSS